MVQRGVWSQEEHDRFLQAIKIHPRGPWRAITKFVGTRSVRQVQTHAQKYNEKIQRRMRGLHKDRKTWARIEHRIDDDVLVSCKNKNDLGVVNQAPLLPTIDPVMIGHGLSFEQLLKLGDNDFVPGSPHGVEEMEPLRVCYSDALIVPQKSLIDVVETETTGELPSLSESLDFLIDCLSD